MSTVMVETAAVTAEPAPTSAPPISCEPVPALRVVKAIPVAPPPKETTFLDDHPLVPVFVIGAISIIMAVAAVASVVFWLAIRYSGVLAP